MPKIDNTYVEEKFEKAGDSTRNLSEKASEPDNMFSFTPAEAAIERGDQPLTFDHFLSQNLQQIQAKPLFVEENIVAYAEKEEKLKINSSEEEETRKFLFSLASPGLTSVGEGPKMAEVEVQ